VACLEKLQWETREARIAALGASIKEAERMGKNAEALRLCDELDLLKRAQRRGGKSGVAGSVQ